MSNTGFENHVGLQLENHFLDADQILRELDDWAAHPGKGVEILGIPAGFNPKIGNDLERLIAVKRHAAFSLCILAEQRIVV
ncbi:hypothetical protein [Prosthecobacter sp.]|uniref:hypothetical protein n=1 Tax=Prosthecobacter sp. TaxID=1965333 RepID=UPI0037C6349A